MTVCTTSVSLVTGDVSISCGTGQIALASDWGLSLLTLDGASGAALASSILLLWALAWGYRTLIRLLASHEI